MVLKRDDPNDSTYINASYIDVSLDTYFLIMASAKNYPLEFQLMNVTLSEVSNRHMTFRYVQRIIYIIELLSELSIF